MNLDETILYLKQFKYNKQKETDNSWCEMLVQHFINEKEENSFNRNQVI